MRMFIHNYLLDLKIFMDCRTSLVLKRLRPQFRSKFIHHLFVDSNVCRLTLTDWRLPSVICSVQYTETRNFGLLWKSKRHKFIEKIALVALGDYFFEFIGKFHFLKKHSNFQTPYENDDNWPFTLDKFWPFFTQLARTLNKKLNY
jgi:hypothetical protein